MLLSPNVPILTILKSFYTGYKFTKYQCHCPRHSRLSLLAFTSDLRLAKILKTELLKEL